MGTGAGVCGVVPRPAVGAGAAGAGAGAGACFAHDQAVTPSAANKTSELVRRVIEELGLVELAPPQRERLLKAWDRTVRVENAEETMPLRADAR